MTSAEAKLAAFGIFLLFLLAVGIGYCSYSIDYLQPKQMAEKGFCWEANSRSYRPCEKR